MVNLHAMGAAKDGKRQDIVHCTEQNYFLLPLRGKDEDLFKRRFCTETSGWGESSRGKISVNPLNLPNPRSIGFVKQILNGSWIPMLYGISP